MFFTFLANITFRQIDIGNFAKFGKTPNSLQERPFGSKKARTQSHRPPTRKFFCLVLTCTCDMLRNKEERFFQLWWMTENPERNRAARTAVTFETRAQIMLVPHCACVSYNSPGYLDTCNINGQNDFGWIRVNASHLAGIPSPRISGYLAIRIRVNAAPALAESCIGLISPVQILTCMHASLPDLDHAESLSAELPLQKRAEVSTSLWLL